MIAENLFPVLLFSFIFILVPKQLYFFRILMQLYFYPGHTNFTSQNIPRKYITKVVKENF